MPRVTLANEIYWVGAIDYNIRDFHGYRTPRGTTYNAYLIVDEKIALVDTVKHGFAEEMLSRIRPIIDPAKIDYLVVNHVEMDHSGSLPEMTKVAAKARIVTNEKAREALQRHYRLDDRFMLVKTGDTLSLGSKTLSFIEAPMLHWPDSMFTYLAEDPLCLCPFSPMERQSRKPLLSMILCGEALSGWPGR